MKAIKARTFFVQNILITISILFAVLGFILMAKSIPFFPSIEAISANGETKINITQSFMSLSHLGLYFSFVFIYLMFEFYGFKPAFYTSINIAISILICYGLIYLLQNFTLNAETSELDLLYSQVFLYHLRDTIALSLAILLSFCISIFLATVLKMIMRNYFMFIRFPIVAAICFAIFTWIHIYISQFDSLAMISMIQNSVTPYSQFLALILASIIPLYIFRLILGLFRGWASDVDEFATDKNLFKGKEAQEIPPAPKLQDAPTSSITDNNIVPIEEEDTESQKVKFN